jgi:hypothetical protein
MAVVRTTPASKNVSDDVIYYVLNIVGPKYGVTGGLYLFVNELSLKLNYNKSIM